jgi:hypothetical protein
MHDQTNDLALGKSMRPPNGRLGMLKSRMLSFVCLFIALLLGSCSSPSQIAIALVTPTATATLTAPPAPTQTPLPPTATAIPPTATLVPPTATIEIPTATATATPTPIPTATLIVNLDDPNRAGVIDGQMHTLKANAAVWYRFEYAVNHMTDEHPVFTLALVYGNKSGVAFEVYSPENINGWWENHPTGRGTVQMIDCDTHEPSESGECESPDLSWAGRFRSDGTIFVRVVNSNGVPSNFILTIH